MKVYTWLRSHKFRILMWILIVFGFLVELGNSGSYILAILNGFGFYGVMWLGSAAFREDV